MYEQTAATDERVSTEVDPRLARDAAATAGMARALRSAVDRDNMFVKVPATPRPFSDQPGHPAQGEGGYRQRPPGLPGLSGRHRQPAGQKLARLGAAPQRPLWASTGVKNHAYPDTIYVTGLVAPGTVNTMPATTLAAFADHAEVTGNTISGRYHDARRVLDQLSAAGVVFDDVTGTTRARRPRHVREELARAGVDPGH